MQESMKQLLKHQLTALDEKRISRDRERERLSSSQGQGQARGESGQGLASLATDFENVTVVMGENDKNWATECGLRLEDELFENFQGAKLYADKARSLLFNLKD